MKPLHSCLALFAAVSAFASAQTAESDPVCEMIFPPEVKGVFSAPQIWPDGEVFYDFAPDVIVQRQLTARSVMDEIESWADVRFLPRQGGEEFWITIRNTTGSNSATVGPARGGVVNIRSWGNRGIIMHELFHTLGFSHEQSRADRDQFVDVDCACISGGCNNGNFRILPNAMLIGPYDFQSITHYPPGFALADGCSSNIQPRAEYIEYNSQMGAWNSRYDGLGSGDTWSLYVMYGGDPKPGPFGRLEPSQNAVRPRLAPIRFRWEESGLADSYRLEVFDTAFIGFFPPVVDVVLTETEYSFLPPADAPFLVWRVVSENHRGVTAAGVQRLGQVQFGSGCGLDLASPEGLDANDIATQIDNIEAADPAADYEADLDFDMFDLISYLGLFEIGC